jgi:hypothetical protein
MLNRLFQLNRHVFKAYLLKESPTEGPIRAAREARRKREDLESSQAGRITSPS